MATGQIKGNAITDSDAGIDYPDMEFYESLWMFIRDSENDPTIFPIQQANIEHMKDRLLSIFNNVRSKEDKIFRKAAYLLQYFARDAHAFNNGNKRMAFVYTSLFLAMNNYEIKIPDEERDQNGTIIFLLNIAKGGETQPSLSRISKWLKRYSMKVPPRKDGSIGKIETLKDRR